MEKYININGRLLDLSTPRVMVILNCTPDSFYEGSRVQTEKAIANRVNEILGQGGDIIDVGAFSTRPGGIHVDSKEEMLRMRHALTILRQQAPDAIVSIDTFRPEIAQMAVEEYGAGIINDVSEGGITGIANVPLESSTGKDCIPDMFRMVSRLRVAYILMSVKPDLDTMLPAFEKEIRQLRSLGQKDIILDPGFGFGKTLEQNYSLLANLERIKILKEPFLVGISRKSMIFRLLGSTPNDSLNGTTVLNTISLLKGASILRVHDVKECVETIRIIEKTRLCSEL